MNFIVHYGEDNEVFQKEIEKEFNLRRSTVTGIVQLMEEKGLITRTVFKDDARVKKVKLTPEGIKLQENLYDDIIKYENMLIDNIEEDKLDIFDEIIKQIHLNIDENVKENIW